ncbi:chromosome segregation protein Spc25-domain-containing protein [Ephemerocybe angulata]|uniref:Kinetochore protein SPC25 n=1 Tax=Ephemerocybe angulata TaxID=980116 RepID=A0A8H6IKV8_9AGAR|nr:chromosome segregation protein Spc25-domain-containing protein [Tulosesus angulatus]
MSVRVPQLDLATILKQPNPHIDLRTNAYETSTRNFLKALTTWKNRSINTISERRKSQVAEKKRLAEKIQQVETETNQCKLREIDLVAELEKEKEERQEMELSVAAFKRQLASLRDKCSSIDSEIEQYRVITENLRREKNKERSILRKNASRVNPDLKFCEENLGFSMEGIENDRLFVRFWRLDPTDPERDASLVLDVSSTSYRVLTSSPLLPSLPILLTSLNETGDIYLFVKQVREKYRELYQGPTS